MTPRSFVLVGLLVLRGASATPPLRVCADPNNLPFSNAAREGFENRIADLLGRELKRPSNMSGGLNDVVS
jgi:mxaJ protein